MTTIKFDSFPAGKVDAARDALDGMYAKLAKAAERAGATPVVMPTLAVSNPRTVYACLHCKAVSTKDLYGHGCGDPYCTGYIVAMDFVTLTVTADTPKLAGWEFLAVVEPMDGGNMVRRVPGSDDTFDLTAYRTADAMTCDHCNTDRARLETFVVRSDGSDPEVVAGTVKRVGRNCLEKFLGGKSAESLLRSMTIEKVLGGLAEEGEGGWGSGGSTVYDPLTTMSWAVSAVRLRGWVSKGAAAAYAEAAGGEATKATTASRVSSMLNPPPRDAKARAEWLAEYKALTPTDVDTDKAGKVLEWAMNLTGTSDYEYNLALVARQKSLDPKNLGIFVSAVGSYDRAMGLASKKAMEAAEKTKAPLGKVEFEGEVIKTSVSTNYFGGRETTVDKMTVKVTTEKGVWLAWGTIPSSFLRLADTVKNKWNEDEIDATTLVGRKVKVKATLEAGKDAHFVFMKRPVVEFADVYSHPVYKAPKVKKTKKVEDAEA